MQGGGTVCDFIHLQYAILTLNYQGQFSAAVYNFVGAWVARKHKEVFGDIQGDPTDHPELIQQLKQAVDNDLKIDYLVTGGCMITKLLSFLVFF